MLLQAKAFGTASLLGGRGWGGGVAGGVGIGKYSLARFDRNCILLPASFIVFSQWY